MIPEMAKLIELLNDDTPRATMIKCCTAALKWLKAQKFTDDNPPRSLGIGVPVYINEEIPPDRIVVYDQFDDVMDVVPIPY